MSDNREQAIDMPQAGESQDFSQVPGGMLTLKNWVAWQYETKPGQTKPSKVPKQPARPQFGASTTRPEHWSTFGAALSAGLEGVGFVFTDSPFCGVDLDFCFDEQDTLYPWAAEIVQAFKNCAYIERSPSNKGLHIICEGVLRADSWHKVKPELGSCIEVYDTGRYFTVTGRGSGDIQNGQNALDWLRGQYRQSVAESTQAVVEIEAESTQAVVDDDVEEFEDSVLIERARNAKNGRDFQALWGGDLSAHEDDHSVADMALCAHLAFWTNGNAAQIDRLFRQSGLMRPKWDERRGESSTYGRDTIAKVLKPDKASETPAKDAAPRPKRRALRRDDIVNGPEIEWTIKGVLPSRGMGCVFGRSTVGKSFLCVDMAAAIAGGWEWFGCRVKPRPVVYVALEGAAGFARRVKAWEAHHGRRYPDGVIFSPDNLDLRKDSDTLDLIELGQAEAGPGAVVIIDTLNRSAPGMDENSSKDYGLIMANAAKVGDALRGFVLFVAHPGKDENKSVRGHSSLFAGMDAVVEVGEDEKTASPRFSWTLKKAKDGQGGIKKFFDRKQVALGSDSDGDPVTSCVIIASEVEVMDNELSQTEQRVFDALCVAWMFPDDDLKAGPPTPVQSKNWTDLVAQWALCSSAQFKRVKQTLVSRGYVSREERGVREVFFIPQV